MRYFLSCTKTGLYVEVSEETLDICVSFGLAAFLTESTLRDINGVGIFPLEPEDGDIHGSEEKAEVLVFSNLSTTEH